MKIIVFPGFIGLHSNCYTLKVASTEDGEYEEEINYIIHYFSLQNLSQSFINSRKKLFLILNKRSSVAVLGTTQQSFYKYFHKY